MYNFSNLFAVKICEYSEGRFKLSFSKPGGLGAGAVNISVVSSRYDVEHDHSLSTVAVDHPIAIADLRLIAHALTSYLRTNDAHEKRKKKPTKRQPKRRSKHKR